jgi:hypothetical protein
MLVNWVRIAKDPATEFVCIHVHSWLRFVSQKTLFLRLSGDNPAIKRSISR